MTALEYYIKETGKEVPCNVIAHSDWLIEYRQWLEKKVEEIINNPKEENNERRNQQVKI